MIESKQWDWAQAEQKYWLQPSEESYYLASRWVDKGFKSVLDLGCGLGRHAIHFAAKGLDVSAFDLSADAAAHLRDWAGKEKLKIDICIGDMLKLPYPDNSFDCVFAYHVISHTDTAGITQIIREIGRVLRPNGEIYLTVCSKETWSFCEAGYPQIDGNTIVKTDEGPEKGVPHFYANLEDIISLFHRFNLIKVRHVDDCYFDGHAQNSKHYFILGQLRD